jgi:hypothetical protein
MFTPGAGLTKAGVELLGAQLAGMTIGEITAMIDSQNLDPVIVFKLIKDIKKLFEALVSLTFYFVFFSRNQNPLHTGIFAKIFIGKFVNITQIFPCFSQFQGFLEGTVSSLINRCVIKALIDSYAKNRRHVFMFSVPSSVNRWHRRAFWFCGPKSITITSFYSYLRLISGQF